MTPLKNLMMHGVMLDGDNWRVYLESHEFEIVAIALQENMVNLSKQLSLPLIEASLVVSKYTKQLTANIVDYAHSKGEVLPQSILAPLPLSDDESNADENYSGMPLEKIIDVVDHERMDIFDTLIRTTINIQEIPIFDALVVLRTWEKLVREQLVRVESVGQLFSPLNLPEDF